MATTTTTTLRGLRCHRCGEGTNVDVRRFLDDDGKRKVEITCAIIVHAEPVLTIIEDPDTPETSIGAGGDSLVHELELYSKLVEVVYDFDTPVEYAVVEHELAERYPEVYQRLWERQGHATTHPSDSYTLSTYLASLLGTLRREESLTKLDTDSTIPWSSSTSASAWSHPGRTDQPVLSWADHADDCGIDPDTWPAAAAAEAAA